MTPRIFTPFIDGSDLAWSGDMIDSIDPESALVWARAVARQRRIRPCNRRTGRFGPGKPCGEYMRRFWMPVAMTDQTGDLPCRIRILGEDLVMFRETGEGRLGLTHMHCAHRNMSPQDPIRQKAAA